jgi:hypothetical protein
LIRIALQRSEHSFDLLQTRRYQNTILDIQIAAARSALSAFAQS